MSHGRAVIDMRTLLIGGSGFLGRAFTELGDVLATHHRHEQPYAPIAFDFWTDDPASLIDRYHPATVVFAAQMLNWPLPGGTSAHFVGGAFAAIVLGPSLGVLSIAIVLVVQALVFGDGGVLALGANVWNMAIVEVYGGYAVYRILAPRNESLAIAVAGWAGITLAALSAVFNWVSRPRSATNS